MYVESLSHKLMHKPHTSKNLRAPWRWPTAEAEKYRSNNTGQQNLTPFVPRTSIGELSSTFYVEFRYVYRIFLPGGVSKVQRILNVQNSTLRAH